jgi:adenylate cyclase
MALNPLCPGMWLHFQGQAYYQLQRYEEAENVLKRRIFRTPEDRRLSCAPGRHLWPDVSSRRGARTVARGRSRRPRLFSGTQAQVADGLRKAALVE